MELIVKIDYNAFMVAAGPPWAIVVAAGEDRASGRGAIWLAAELFDDEGVDDPNRVIAPFFQTSSGEFLDDIVGEVLFLARRYIEASEVLHAYCLRRFCEIFVRVKPGVFVGVVEDDISESGFLGRINGPEALCGNRAWGRRVKWDADGRGGLGLEVWVGNLGSFRWCWRGYQEAVHAKAIWVVLAEACDCASVADVVAFGEGVMA